jgi:16S rRNA (guanine527-N7)-methyltransferase
MVINPDFVDPTQPTGRFNIVKLKSEALIRMSEFIHLLKDRMKERGFLLDEYQLTLFDVYRRELKEWNTRINLTSVTDDPDIIDKHFIDSLLIFRYWQIEQGSKVADVGTGAGFPGIPIKIYRQDIRLMLLESIGKKARFSEHIIARLKLENVDVVNDRAEVIARLPEYREQYDLVVARCVAELPVLAEYCLPLVSVGGKFVAYKGHRAEEEIRDAEAALRALGGQFERIERDDSCVDGRALIFIGKVKETSKQYPRRSGMPKKRPL